MNVVVIALFISAIVSLLYLCDSFILPFGTNTRRRTFWTRQYSSIHHHHDVISNNKNNNKKNDNVLLREAQEDPKLYTFSERVEHLKEYKRVYGNCLVPRRSGRLGVWVNRQRQHKKNGRLSPERIQCLDHVGMIWNATRNTNSNDDNYKNNNNQQQRFATKHWYNQFDKLKELRGKRVDSKSTLGVWCQRQRAEYKSFLAGKNSRMNREKIKALQSIGFDWRSSLDQIWFQRLHELEQYKKVHGNCLVPITFENKTLANWVSHQRKLYRHRLEGGKNSLSNERIRLLNRIGFVWERWGLSNHYKN